MKKTTLLTILLMSVIWSCKKEEPVNTSSSITPPVAPQDTVAIVSIGKENNNLYFYYKIDLTIKVTQGGGVISANSYKGQFNNSTDTIYNCTPDGSHELGVRFKKIVFPIKNLPKSGTYYSDVVISKSADGINYIQQSGAGGPLTINYVPYKNYIAIKDTMAASFGGACIGL